MPAYWLIGAICATAAGGDDSRDPSSSATSSVQRPLQRPFNMAGLLLDWKPYGTRIDHRSIVAVPAFAEAGLEPMIKSCISSPPDRPCAIRTLKRRTGRPSRRFGPPSSPAKSAAATERRAAPPRSRRSPVSSGRAGNSSAIRSATCHAPAYSTPRRPPTSVYPAPPAGPRPTLIPRRCRQTPTEDSSGRFLDRTDRGLVVYRLVVHATSAPASGSASISRPSEPPTMSARERSRAWFRSARSYLPARRAPSEALRWRAAGAFG